MLSKYSTSGYDAVFRHGRSTSTGTDIVRILTAA